MSDEATNWVTIKIPDATRDKAQKDERTYQEIMEAGLDEVVQTPRLSEEHIKHLIQESTEVVEVDESEIANEIATQLQLDMAQLANRTADEVERRLR